MNDYYEIRNDLDDLWSDGILFDIFDGNLNPNQILKNNDDIIEVENAIEIIKKYVETLENSEKIGES